MKQNELTFNDLPQVVAELRDEVSALAQLIRELQNEITKSKVNTHHPMTAEQAAEYLQMPLGTLYMKLGSGEIPATKPGKRYVLFRDELDKWLEANRKNPVPLTAEDKAKNQLIIDFEDLGCSARLVRGEERCRRRRRKAQRRMNAAILVSHRRKPSRISLYEEGGGL